MKLPNKIGTFFESDMKWNWIESENKNKPDLIIPGGKVKTLGECVDFLMKSHLEWPSKDKQHARRKDKSSINMKSFTTTLRKYLLKKQNTYRGLICKSLAFN